MKAAIYCVICKKEIDLLRGINLDHECGCYSHARCHGPDDTDPQCALHKPESAAAKLATPLVEPRYPGQDWVAQGYVEPTFTQKTSKWAKKADTPHGLMQKGVPLEDMIRQKKWGLGHLYSDWGIRLEDFLKCGYSLDKLQVFEDVRDRPLDTLITLGLDADLLKEYPKLLPADVLRERYGMTVEDIGPALRFDVKRGLCTSKTANWSLDNLIYLGYTWNDLVTYLGLKNPDHWDDLEPTTEHLKRLGCTQEQVEEHFGVLPQTPASASAVQPPVVEKQPLKLAVSDAPSSVRRNRILK